MKEAIEETLHTLLRRNTANMPVDTSFDNELSVALVALKRMGAGVRELKRMDALYRSCYALKPVPPGLRAGRIDEYNWLDFLGQQAYFPAYMEFFRKEARKHSLQHLLEHYFAELAAGSFASNFYGLIRLACARECENTDEACLALAFIAAHYRTMPAPAQDVHPLTLWASLTQLKNESVLVRLSGNGKIADKMRIIVDLPAFRQRLYTLPSHYALGDIALQLVHIYTRTGDPAVAQAISSCHALRLLWPFVAGRSGLLQNFWTAVCALWVAAGMGAEASGPVEQNEAPWPVILEKTFTSRDVHTIKLVYACWQEWQYYREALYQQVATACAEAVAIESSL